MRASSILPVLGKIPYEHLDVDKFHLCNIGFQGIYEFNGIYEYSPLKFLGTVDSIANKIIWKIGGKNIHNFPENSYFIKRLKALTVFSLSKAAWNMHGGKIPLKATFHRKRVPSWSGFIVTIHIILKIFSRWLKCAWWEYTFSASWNNFWTLLWQNYNKVCLEYS